MENLLRILSKLATPLGISVLLIVLLVSILVYQNLGFISKITFELKNFNERKEGEKGQNESIDPEVMRNDLKIKNVFLPPLDTKLPSSIYFELINTAKYSVQNVSLSINFGRSKIKEFEFFPKTKIDSNEKSQSVF